ncbi:retropepsin-like aspartic protease [Streptomyces sp. NPDC048564]|uniref:retropepsin-like aspartic protease n=1 Tax=Streptomyces sp. NPDC048564 TaxID=3155760 RepID=UPI003438DB08
MEPPLTRVCAALGWALRPREHPGRHSVRREASAQAPPTLRGTRGSTAAGRLCCGRGTRRPECGADFCGRGTAQGCGAGRPDAGVRPREYRGPGPFSFALDTGASTSVVDENVANRVGLERTGERRSVSGVLGTGEVPVARVDQWEVGDIRLDPGEVTVIDLGPPRGGGGIQGLLGSDVLSDFGSITVDYDDGVLTIPAP